MASGGKQVVHVPDEKTRRMVWIMSATGIPRRDIARALGVTQPTLRKRYPEELERGKLEANANVASTLYDQCMRGHVRAIMFWLRTQAGWAERSEISGPDGEAIPIREVRRRVIDPAPPAIDDDTHDDDGDDDANGE